MLYTLLGKLVWRIAKLFLRRKYGATYLPKPVVAGGLVAVLVGLLVLLGRREDGGGG
jgi:hypothetical protein